MPIKNFRWKDFVLSGIWLVSLKWISRGPEVILLFLDCFCFKFLMVISGLIYPSNEKYGCLV